MTLFRTEMHFFNNIERGIVKNVHRDSKSNDALYEMKFRYDKRVTTPESNILASSERDVLILPREACNFVQQAKCLTSEEIEMIKI